MSNAKRNGTRNQGEAQGEGKAMRAEIEKALEAREAELADVREHLSNTEQRFQQIHGNALVAEANEMHYARLLIPRMMQEIQQKDAMIAQLQQTRTADDSAANEPENDSPDSRVTSEADELLESAAPSTGTVPETLTGERG